MIVPKSRINPEWIASKIEVVRDVKYDLLWRNSSSARYGYLGSAADGDVDEWLYCSMSVELYS